MKKRVQEETIIIVSVAKWIVLATIVGVIVGVSTTLFVKTLNRGAELTKEYPYYFLMIPIGLLASTIIIKYIFPQAEGHGANRVIESVHKFSGKLKPIMVPVEFLRTFITLTSGGSAGKEGPSAQIGAGLASMFADLLKFEGADRRKLVICGISGGFASVFGTPLAGAIFGIEVLFAGSILYEVLLPSFVAGIISYQVSSWLGLTYFYHPVSFVPVFSEAFFLKVVIAGVFFGLSSFLLVETLRLGNKISKSIKLPMEIKSVAAGAVLVVLTLIFSTHYLGLGLETLQSALEGKDVPWYAFIMKAIFTSITLNFGGSGGIGTPIFFVGATAGNFFSKILDVDASMLAAIGFVSLLAGAANTPIAASIMSVELFGAEVAPYAAIACVISFLITGHRSAYPSQVLAVRKSSSIDVSIGEELSKVKPDYQYRDKSLIGVVKSFWKVSGRNEGKR
ncbi:MAG: chloride channel protein [Deltaproteobacteria bacterium]|nr:chloride channel protein [Deltaproteobacteria bacterium]